METINLGENIVFVKVQDLSVFAKKDGNKISVNVMLPDFDTLDASVNLETLIIELRQVFKNESLTYKRLTDNKITIHGVELN